MTLFLCLRKKAIRTFSHRHDQILISMNLFMSATCLVWAAAASASFWPPPPLPGPLLHSSGTPPRCPTVPELSPHSSIRQTLDFYGWQNKLLTENTKLYTGKYFIQYTIKLKIMFYFTFTNVILFCSNETQQSFIFFTYLCKNWSF